MQYKEFAKLKMSSYGIRFNQEVFKKLDGQIKINKISTNDISNELLILFHLSNFQATRKKFFIGKNRIEKFNTFIGHNEWLSYGSVKTMEPSFFYVIPYKNIELKDLNLRNKTCYKKFYQIIAEVLLGSYRKNGHDIEEEIVNILFKLRMLHNQEIWNESILVLAKIRGKFWNILYNTNLQRGGSLYGSNTYKFNKNDVNAFIKIMKDINMNEINSCKELKMALGFFDASYQLSPLYQKFINLTICLESLLNPTDHDELRYRISNRVAVLLAKKNLRKEVAKLVKNFYDLRSKIVHGSFQTTNVMADDISQQQLSSLRNCVRTLINKYIKLRLQKKLSHENIHQLLDEAMLDYKSEKTLNHLLQN